MDRKCFPRGLAAPIVEQDLSCLAPLPWRREAEVTIATYVTQ
jgi:hypothetical protein